VFKNILNKVFLKKISQSLYCNDIHQKRSEGSQGSAYDDYHPQFTLWHIKIKDRQTDIQHAHTCVYTMFNSFSAMFILNPTDHRLGLRKSTLI
jgi:hypothetical protein